MKKKYILNIGDKHLIYFGTVLKNDSETVTVLDEKIGKVILNKKFIVSEIGGRY